MKNALFKLCLVVCLLAGIALVVGGILFLGFLFLYHSTPDMQDVPGGEEFFGLGFSAVFLGLLLCYLRWLLLRSKRSGEQSAQSSLKRCQHCGSHLMDNSKTCKYCGARLHPL